MSSRRLRRTARLRSVHCSEELCFVELFVPESFRPRRVGSIFSARRGGLPFDSGRWFAPDDNWSAGPLLSGCLLPDDLEEEGLLLPRTLGPRLRRDAVLVSPLSFDDCWSGFDVI